MASEIQVYKAAALGVGSETNITSPTDDRPLAKKIRAAWDLNRRAAIREGSWNFATVLRRLPALNEIPDHSFDHAFKLPAGCLRMLEVFSGGTELGAGEWMLSEGKILTSADAPLDVKCLVDVTEPALWDDAFAAAFGQRIAWQIGTSVAGSSFSEATAERKYWQLLRSAKRVDASEAPPIERAESSWIEARHASGDYGTMAAGVLSGE